MEYRKVLQTCSSQSNLYELQTLHDLGSGESLIISIVQKNHDNSLPCLLNNNYIINKLTDFTFAIFLKKPLSKLSELHLKKLH